MDSILQTTNPSTYKHVFRTSHKVANIQNFGTNLMSRFSNVASLNDQENQNP